MWVTYFKSYPCTLHHAPTYTCRVITLPRVSVVNVALRYEISIQNQYGATPQSTDEFGNPVTTYTGSEPHRERGMMDKIKEKLPGTHDPYSSHSQATHTTAPYAGTGYTGSEQHHGMMDKITDPYSSHSHTTGTTAPYGGTGYAGTEHRQQKGTMDKIKEKLPGTGGHRADDPYSSHSHTTTTTTPYDGTTTYSRSHQPREKKGMMDKIKEKLPGGHH